MKKNIIQDSISNYAVMGLQMAIGVIAIPVYIETFGAELYGVYLLSVGLASTLLFLEFGSSPTILRYTAEYLNDGDERRYAAAVRTCLTITAITCGLLAAIFVAVAQVQEYVFNIAPAYRDEAYRLLMGTAVFAALNVAAQLPRAVLRGAGVFYVRNRFVAVELALRGLALVLIWYYRLDVMYLLLFETAILLVGTAFDFAVLRRHLPRLLDPDLLRGPTGRPLFGGEIFTYIKETFSISIVGLLNQQLDRVIIAVFLDVRFVTVYAVVSKPYAIVKTVVSKTYIVFAEYYVRIYHERGKDALREFLSRFALLINGALSVALLPFALTLPTLVYYWLGTREYDPYIIYGQLMILGYTVKMLGGMFNCALVINGQTRRIVLLETASALLNFVVSVALVPLIGVGGVLMGTFVQIVIGTPVLIWISDRWLGGDGKIHRARSGFRAIFRRLLLNGGLIVAVVAVSAFVRTQIPPDTQIVAAVSAAAVIALAGLGLVVPRGLREFSALREKFL